MADPLHHFIPLPDATVELRRAFGRFGTGVTIVTVQTANGPLGMTANSFSSVSLDPPLVQWSPALSSKRHDAFTNAAQFAVHILGSGQRALADAFAVSGDAFDQFDWTIGPNGAPTLAGCLASFHCDTFGVHPAGDHSIVLGQVTHAAYDPDDSVAGLMYDQGRYGRFTPLTE
ncbi:flavin reductase family protein [Sulfitobacter sp. EE-36]|uniref:flavin reductase family protein n=1 Tax=Sulfitobacter TaxID=60136 RepID=UPI000066A9D4|nr:flavin reductase family protein [Sulfitobacter sp. EE-36]EAP84785.1 flavin reductase domain protein [Sulfitobacter sp. EE-36]